MDTTESAPDKPRRTTQEDLLEALAEGVPRDNLTAEGWARLEDLEPLARQALKDQAKAKRSMDKLLESGGDILEMITYGHGDDTDPTNPRGVAIQGDEAPPEDMALILAVLHLLGEVVDKNDKDAAELRHRLNRFATWGAVSTLVYGYISKIGAAIRRSSQQVRRLVEHKNAYPGFTATTNPNRGSRWGHRGMKSPEYLKRAGRAEEVDDSPAA